MQNTIGSTEVLKSVLKWLRPLQRLSTHAYSIQITIVLLPPSFSVPKSVIRVTSTPPLFFSKWVPQASLGASPPVAESLKVQRKGSGCGEAASSIPAFSPAPASLGQTGNAPQRPLLTAAGIPQDLELARMESHLTEDITTPQGPGRWGYFTCSTGVSFLYTPPRPVHVQELGADGKALGLAHQGSTKFVCEVF